MPKSRNTKRAKSAVSPDESQSHPNGIDVKRPSFESALQTLLQAKEVELANTQAEIAGESAATGEISEHLDELLFTFADLRRKLQSTGESCYKRKPHRLPASVVHL